MQYSNLINIRYLNHLNRIVYGQRYITYMVVPTNKIMHSYMSIIESCYLIYAINHVAIQPLILIFLIFRLN
jgi:hypothetical protein